MALRQKSLAQSNITVLRCLHLSSDLDLTVNYPEANQQITIMRMLYSSSKPNQRTKVSQDV